MKSYVLYGLVSSDRNSESDVEDQCEVSPVAELLSPVVELRKGPHTCSSPPAAAPSDSAGAEASCW